MMDVMLVRQFEFESVSELYLLRALKLNTAPGWAGTNDVGKTVTDNLQER